MRPKTASIVLSLLVTGLLLVLLTSGLQMSGLQASGLFTGGPLGGATARAGATAHFIAPGGSGSACSQTAPCALQTALAAAGDGDTLYLAGGTYTGSGGAVITLTANLTLTGGWDGSSAVPPVVNPGAYPSRINGESLRRGVFVGNTITATLEGLTIMSGTHTSKGAGIYARDARLTLRAMEIISNVIDVYDIPNTYAYGSGVMVEGGALVVEDSTFRANSAWARKQTFGGGLAISNTLAATVTGSLFHKNDAWQASGIYFRGHPAAYLPFTLTECTFTRNGRGESVGRASGGYSGAVAIVWSIAHLEGNTMSDNHASNDYGALSIMASQGLLTRNTLTGNTCARTAGLYLYNVTPMTIANNIIAGNSALYDWLHDNSAVQVRGGESRFLHNTIARNAFAYGIKVNEGATAALTNTILLSHTVGISVTAGSTATLEGTLWGSGAWANAADWGGAGAIITGATNIWGDPAFVNPSAADYHISPGSAALDAGVHAGVNAAITTDVDGDPRPAGTGPDIGADEIPVRLYLPLILRGSS